MSSLDAEIQEILDIFSLLIVFVIAYFTALMPRLEELMEQPRPQVARDRTRLGAKLSAYQRILAAFIGVILLVMALAVPIALEVIASFDINERFSTLRGGFLLLVLLLLASLVWVVHFELRLRLRRREVVNERA
jgi:4-amino-4-deoxy-L-arabinose transferase-like glycosyltransferase